MDDLETLDILEPLENLDFALLLRQTSPLHPHHLPSTFGLFVHYPGCSGCARPSIS